MSQLTGNAPPPRLTTMPVTPQSAQPTAAQDAPPAPLLKPLSLGQVPSVQIRVQTNGALI
jgi:hypothetical protein